MSKDLENIKAEATQRKRIDDVIKSAGLDVPQPEIARDFELVARALNGEEAAKLPAMRCLVRRFGRWGALDLILAASEKSYHQWRLSIQKRTYAEQPDDGKQKKKWEKEIRMNRIGLTYYDYRICGFSDLAAIQKTRKRLRLNLSDRTIRQELHLFRQAAKRRGYVDPYAAEFSSFCLVHYREPKILVSDLTQKGRPKKNIQKRPDRNGLYPEFEPR